MKKLLLNLSFAVVLAFGAAAQTIEVDGLYYTVSQSGDSQVANLVAKPDGTPYSGKIILPNSIMLTDGSEVLLNKGISVFNNSEVEELTVDMIPFEDNRQMSVMFRNDPVLSRVQFNHMCDPNAEGYYPTANVNLGGNHECVHCFVREGEEENLVVVDKFNVYGPDGKLLKPVLMAEGSHRIIYPDEDNIFHLDKNWRSDDEYCIVLPLSNYIVIVLFGIDENGNVIGVRTESEPTHTGLYATDGGFTYEIVGSGAILNGRNESAQILENVVIPATVEYQNAQYPVKGIGVSAFDKLEMKSIELPASVDTIYGSYPLFYECPNLESADLSATQIKTIRSFATACPELTEVKFPETLTYLTNAFSYCNAIERVEVPAGCKYLGSIFRECPSVKEFEIPVDANYNSISFNSGLVEASGEWVGDNYIFTISHMGIKYMDGTSPEYNAFNYFYFSYTVADPEEGTSPFRYETIFNNGELTDNPMEYSFAKSDFYAPEYADPFYKNRFFGNIYLGTHEDFDEVNNRNPQIHSLAQFTVPDPESVDIRIPETATAEGPIQFFNLQGIPVSEDNLTPGIYIRRQGNRATKVLIQ